jgi:DNA-binding response OmpR family regulator
MAQRRSDLLSTTAGDQLVDIGYASAMLDFGSASVDGWLASLGAAELGVEQEMLDAQAHELVLDGQRVKLTKLEFEVCQYLYERKGLVVSRASRVEEVWGWNHTGSNVVEAVCGRPQEAWGSIGSD